MRLLCVVLLYVYKRKNAKSFKIYELQVNCLIESQFTHYDNASVILY